MARTFLSLGALLAAMALLAAAPGQSAGPVSAGSTDSANKPTHTTETLRGRVVWLDEALARRFEITTDPAAAKTVVLDTTDGRLVPLAPDVRGWAFAVDERLRNVELELLIRRHANLPWVQVIRVLNRTSGGLFEIDYWCDVCAISMFTLKSCECCQGPTRLRETPVDE